MNVITMTIRVFTASLRWRSMVFRLFSTVLAIIVAAAVVLGEPPIPGNVWPEGEETRLRGVQLRAQAFHPNGWVGKPIPTDLQLRLDSPSGELFSPSQDAQTVHRVEVTGSFN